MSPLYGMQFLSDELCSRVDLFQPAVWMFIPAWSFLCTAGKYLLIFHSLHKLQGTICSSARSTYSPSFSHLGCFSYFFSPPLLTLPGSIFPFLEHTITEVPLSWLRSSSVLCDGSDGAVWNQLCPVWGRPGLSSLRPLLQISPGLKPCLSKYIKILLNYFISHKKILLI